MGHKKRVPVPARHTTTVLVTGANGFVGSHVIDALLEGGHRAVGLVRRTSDLTWLRGKPLELRYGDVVYPESLPPVLNGIEWVVHTAGLVRARRPADFYRVNAEGVENLVRSCVASGSVRGVVHVSSLAAAGPSPDGVRLREDAPCRPLTDYGKSKLEGERIALSYGERLSVTVLRPPAIFGPRDRATLPFFRMAFWGVGVQVGGGERRLSLCYGPELARACRVVLEEAPSASGVYFVSNRNPISYAALFSLLGEAVGTSPRRIVLPRALVSCAARFSEFLGRWSAAAPRLSRQKVLEISQPAWVCDPSALHRAFGFCHEEELAAQCAATARWYRERKWL